MTLVVAVSIAFVIWKCQCYQSTRTEAEVTYTPPLQQSFDVGCSPHATDSWGAVVSAWGANDAKAVCEQAARNYHAMLAARALGRLAGLLQGKLASAPCQAAREALSALLTPALAAQLANPDPKPLLMHLNSSLLNPQARPAVPICVALNLCGCPAPLQKQSLNLLFSQVRTSRREA